ncbi:hypothetical protein [Actinophytocola glycyrrhizae]|uniref:Uncharacterized protein n=1 Tax=Actinophytocola glycyrrhizae TaxID=2044873 RepID=A0ABV9S7I6_9PSEU
MGALFAVAVAVFTTRLQADEAARRSSAEQAEREVQIAKAAQQAREDQAEREIQQARLVTVEFTPSEWDDPEFSSHYDLTVRITNHSAALILDPRLEEFVHPEKGGEVADVPAYTEYQGAPSVLRTDGTDMLLVTTTYRPALASNAVGPSQRVEAVIGFTDAAGLRWRRVGSSLPVRVPVNVQSEGVDMSVAHTFRPNGPDWYRYEV